MTKYLFYSILMLIVMFYWRGKVPEQYSKETATQIKIGLYACLVVAALLIYLGIHKEKSVQNAESYEVSARFGRTDGLLPGDKVRMAGMTIGSVVDAQLDDKFHAILTLDIDSSVQIPDDSNASIVSEGIMGKKYIEIEPGGSPDYLAPGGEFSYTQDAMVMEELIDRIVSIGKANKKNCK